MKFKQFNPLSHPILFKHPLRHTAGVYSLSWKGHIPFGMLLIELVRPKKLVELGTEKGISYCAFCQAAEFLNLSTQFYAVDSWIGDDHTGAYGEETLKDLREFHDPRYGAFSSLLQMTFDEALDHFEDGTINLLHIDGCHTYDATMHDFNTWLPKLAPGAIVLMHDVHEFKEDFGAWKVWEEVSQGRPSFKFNHSHGLGVLAVDDAYPESLKFLFEATEQETVVIRELFNNLGRRCTVEHLYKENILTSEQLVSQIREKDKKIEGVTASYDAENRKLKNTQYELQTAHEELKKTNQEVWGIYEKLKLNYAELQTQHEQLNYDATLVRSHLSLLTNRNLVRLVNKMHNRVGWLKCSIEKKIGRFVEPDTFDAEAYLQKYPDVAEKNIDPYIHYCIWGWWKGCNPNDNFDIVEYLKEHPDVLWEGKEPYFTRMAKSDEKVSISSEVEKSPASQTTTVQVMEDLYSAYSKPSEFPYQEPESDFKIRQAGVKVIPFYLPQYHPIPENDKFWGKGFTEWTNVAKARPLFQGHYQPHLPGELGYYDTRLREVLERQIELAKQVGIYGFCLHHYWFNGKPLLRVPYNHIMDNPDLDIKFCLNWANEPWTAKFDGYGDKNIGNILLEQRHNPDDDIAFVHDIAPALADERYIRIDDRPILLVYRTDLFPNIRETADRWRQFCLEEGLGDLFLVGIQNSFEKTKTPATYNFDALVEFPPLSFERKDVRNEVNLYDPDFPGEVLSYQAIVDSALEKKVPDYTLFRGAMPGWDNTARRMNCAIFEGSSPDSYQKWLTSICRYTVDHLPEDKRLVFINAWNEWGEGAYLEPDRVYGYAYLNATARALISQDDTKTRQYCLSNRGVILFIGHDAARAGAQILLLDIIRWIKTHTDFEIRVLLVKSGAILDTYQKLVPTIVIEHLQKQHSREELSQKIKDFHGENIKLVYLNSVVSAASLPYLDHIEAPIIAHYHELEESIRKYAGTDKVSLIDNVASQYIAASEPVASNLVHRHGIDAKKIETIDAFIAPTSKQLDSIDVHSERLRLGLPADKIIIFGCGTRDWRKGPDIFVEVAKSLINRGETGFHFCWIGPAIPGEYDDLEIGVEMNGLSGEISFAGMQINPREFFALGDIFLLSSREDPFPLVCLEAAEYELPIVCFADAGGMPGFVEDDAGFVVSFEDVETAANKIALLVKDKKLREKLGKRAKTKLFERHVVDVAAPLVLDTIRKTTDIKPAVSIIVPAYNHSDYLTKRLDSIFNQTYRDFEVILLDDASSDNTAEILQQYANEKPYVTVMINKTNSGTTFAQWIKGMELARADILWIAEDDDFCDPTFLEKMLPYFNDPDVKLAYCQSNAVDADDNVLFSYHDYTSEFAPQRWKGSYVADAEEELNSGLAIKNIIPNASGVLFRKFDMGDWVAADGGMGLAGDWSFYMHTMQGGNVAYHSEHLNYHRRHENTNIHRTQHDESRFRESVLVQATAKRLFNLSDKTLGQMRETAWGVWQEVYPKNKRDLFNMEYEELLNGSGREIAYKTDGYCPICESNRTFVSYETWLRDHYRCAVCFSQPRNRAIRRVLDQQMPNWAALRVYEVAPNNRFLKQSAENYSWSHYYPDHPMGEIVNGSRNENIEQLTIENNTIDVLVHLDVMEHIFNPSKAIREMVRVICPGGAIFFTVPIHKDKHTTICRARIDEEGVIEHLHPEEYHGSPVGEGRSLVVWDYGQDFIEKLNEWTVGLDVKIYHDNTIVPEMGIEGEFLDVFCIRKISSDVKTDAE